MKPKLILVGASTGGPGHLKRLFKNLKTGNSSVVIAQHMNLMFIPNFITQLSREFGLDVAKIDGKTELKSGIYVCEKNSEILPFKPLTAKVCDPAKDTPYHPNVDVLFHSGAKACSFCDVMAVLLTGIGDDGATGLNELYKAGAKCIAESEASAIVYGMPKRAKEINPNLKMLSIDQIRIEIERFVGVF